MHDPCTLAFSFPPYPRGGMSLKGHPKPWSIGRALYALNPWIGVDIWHVDPEKSGTGNRTDDSCGWFDRTPGEYAAAVETALADKGLVQDIANTLLRREWHRSAYLDEYPKDERGYEKLGLADALALSLMVARFLERERWCRRLRDAALLGRMIRRRSVDESATDLALNHVDNLQAVDTPEAWVRCIASALNRRFRPWWKHPRWHVHHWKINFALARNLRRMVQPCATCGKRLGFGYCPTDAGNGTLHHGTCLGRRAAVV